MMIMKWYLDSRVTMQRRLGLFEDRVLRIFGPQWENITGEVLGYHISVDEGSSLLAYDAVSIGN